MKKLIVLFALLAFSLTAFTATADSGGIFVEAILPKTDASLQFQIPELYVDNETLTSPLTLTVLNHNKKELHKQQTNDLTLLLPDNLPNGTFYVKITIGSYTAIQKWTK